MDKRILKRFRREHGKRTDPPNGEQWRFHIVQWGDLKVSVMPRSDPVTRKVTDSNTGVVVEAPFHGALRGCIVVVDGSRPNCDEAALNMHITGDRKKYWANVPGMHPYCIPRRRMEEAGRNEAYQAAVDAIMQGKGYTREHAEWRADQVLGWCPDSIQCGSCQLLIPGFGGKELTDQAREYGWKIAGPWGHGCWRCPACSRSSMLPVPSAEELAAMFPEDFAAAS